MSLPSHGQCPMPSNLCLWKAQSFLLKHVSLVSAAQPAAVTADAPLVAAAAATAAADAAAVMAAAAAKAAARSRSNGAGHPQRRPAPAAMLHRHALESIFAFLGFREDILPSGNKEFTAVLRVSRDWLAAVRSMGRLQLTVCPEPTEPLVVVADSVIARHVAEIVFNCERAYIHPDTLAVLAAHMPHLRELSCRLWLPPPGQPIVFPANLQRLTIKMSPADPAVINGAIAAISRLPLLEQLGMFLHTIDPQVSFAPLVSLPQLHSFRLWKLRDPDELSDAQVDQLRALLPQLREVRVIIATNNLRRLLRQPQQLQLQHLTMPWTVDDEAAALLSHLSSLIEISILVECDRFEWLRGLPNLTDVNLTFNSAGDARRSDSLVAGLQSCTNIATLNLGYCEELTAAQLADLLPRLPRLRELWLQDLHIDSLSFLAQPPMTEQLSALELHTCNQLPLTELRHVHALKALKALVLADSFTAPMDAHSQSLFEPPSALMPLLEYFIYSAPNIHGV